MQSVVFVHLHAFRQPDMRAFPCLVLKHARHGARASAAGCLFPRRDKRCRLSSSFSSRCVLHARCSIGDSCCYHPMQFLTSLGVFLPSCRPNPSCESPLAARRIHGRRRAPVRASCPAAGAAATRYSSYLVSGRPSGFSGSLSLSRRLWLPSRSLLSVVALSRAHMRAPVVLRCAVTCSIIVFFLSLSLSSSLELT